MTLITIDRFTNLLRNAFRVVGPYAPDLPFAVSPVYDLARPDAITDDSVAFWFTTSRAVAALAANFSTVAVRVNGGGRFIVDGISINTQVALQQVVIGLAAGASASTAAAFLGNPFSIRSGFSSPQTLGAVDINVEQTVGGRLAGTGYAVSVPANQALLLSREAGTLPPLVLTPAAGGGTAFNLIIETLAVNAALSIGGVFGRWFPEAPTA